MAYESRKLYTQNKSILDSKDIRVHQNDILRLQLTAQRLFFPGRQSLPNSKVTIVIFIFQKTIQPHIDQVNCRVILFSIYFYLTSVVTSNQNGVLFFVQLQWLPVDFESDPSIVKRNTLQANLGFSDQKVFPYLYLGCSFPLDPHKSALCTAQVIYFFPLVDYEVFGADGGRLENVLDFGFFAAEDRFRSGADVEGDIGLVGLNTFNYSQTNIKSEWVIRQTQLVLNFHYLSLGDGAKVEKSPIHLLRLRHRFYYNLFHSNQFKYQLRLYQIAPPSFPPHSSPARGVYAGGLIFILMFPHF